ncbi:type II secretion system protein N [uncultured Parasphingopyxis sp.]|uniref:type II secretion system protein N n=1 Tax=uncultured Parasphingopyxis sp. TaxID=1547918 RepID=UPI0026145093|nr:type II secretion system protein N [uncultured Parasphingopyxis sp.]
MRFRLPLGRTLFFVCMFVLAFIVLIPLRLGLSWLQLDDYGLAAREARGSIWNGALVEAQYRSADLGDVEAGIGFFPLLIGRARLGMDRDGVDDEAAGAFHGSVSVFGANLHFDDMTANLPANGLFDPLPVGTIAFEGLTAHFEGGLCTEAEGLAQAQVVADTGPLSLPQTLTGNARCDEGKLLLPLVGASGMEQFNLRLGTGGDYEAEIVVNPRDEATRAQLIAAGMQPSGGGFRMAVSGSL